MILWEVIYLSVEIKTVIVYLSTNKPCVAMWGTESLVFKWPVLHVVREILVMFMSRFGISSSVKTEQCYRCFLSQLDNVYWRKGKHWCFEFLLFFFHVNAFWLRDFCIWVGWFEGVQVNQPHREFYIWSKPYGWLCKQKLNNPRKCHQSSHCDESFSFPSYKTKSRTLVWVWESQLCYPNYHVQICPWLSQYQWHVGPNTAGTWNNMDSKKKKKFNQGNHESMQKAGSWVSCSLLLNSQVPPSDTMVDTVQVHKEIHTSSWRGKLCLRTVRDPHPDQEKKDNKFRLPSGMCSLHFVQ